MKALIGLAVVAALFGIIIVASVIGVNNSAVEQEKGIQAQWDQNRNSYDAFVKTVAETAQVPEMYRDDLRKVYVDAIGARYGKEGSQALFQFIQEKNPDFDSSLYRKIQDVIEAGRRTFENNQKQLIDKKRVYETYLATFPNSLIAGVLGYPRIDLSKYDIMTSNRTEKAFAEKKDEPIELRRSAAQ